MKYLHGHYTFIYPLARLWTLSFIAISLSGCINWPKSAPFIMGDGESPLKPGETYLVFHLSSDEGFLYDNNLWTVSYFNMTTMRDNNVDNIRIQTDIKKRNFWLLKVEPGDYYVKSELYMGYTALTYDVGEKSYHFTVQPDAINYIGSIDVYVDQVDRYTGKKSSKLYRKYTDREADVRNILQQSYPDLIKKYPFVKQKMVEKTIICSEFKTKCP